MMNAKTAIKISLAIIATISGYKYQDNNFNDNNTNNIEIETEIETSSYNINTMLSENVLLNPNRLEIETINISEIETTTEYETEKIIETTYADIYEFIPLSKSDRNVIQEICCEYELSFDLMMAIAKQESNYNMSAYNPISGDYGLFQINMSSWNETAMALGFYNYQYSVYDNTRMACWIIRYCLDLSNGDLRIALNYYRTGTPYPKYEANSDYATIILNNINEIEYQKGV